VATHLLWRNDTGELYNCTFLARTPAGTLSGTSTKSQSSRCRICQPVEMALTLDPASSEHSLKFPPDLLFDMVRSQSLADGSFTTVMPLRGDIVLTPNARIIWRAI